MAGRRLPGGGRRHAIPAANFARADAGQIFHGPIRSAGFQFFQFGPAGGHGQCFCADEFSAAHIERRIADDDDFLRLQVFVQHAAAAFQRGNRDVIAVFVVIGKAAELEKIPQAELAQFDFRAELDVAGEQAQRRRLRQCLQIADEFKNSGAGVAGAVCKDVIQPEDVSVQKLPEVPRRLIETVDFEEFPDEAHIGPAGEFHLFRAVMEIEFRRKGFRERACAGMPGVDKRAVYVEKYQPNHAGKYQEAIKTARLLRG